MGVIESYKKRKFEKEAKIESVNNSSYYAHMLTLACFLNSNVELVGNEVQVSNKMNSRENATLTFKPLIDSKLQNEKLESYIVSQYAMKYGKDSKVIEVAYKKLGINELTKIILDDICEEMYTNPTYAKVMIGKYSQIEGLMSKFTANENGLTLDQYIPIMAVKNFSGEMYEDSKNLDGKTATKLLNINIGESYQKATNIVQTRDVLVEKIAQIKDEDIKNQVLEETRYMIGIKETNQIINKLENPDLEMKMYGLSDNIHMINDSIENVTDGKEN